jgi:hypothetical protein
MALELAFFNPLAIILCIFLNMIIGALWYSPFLFGDLWLRLIQQAQNHQRDVSTQEAKTAMSLSVIPASLLIVCLWLLLAFTGANSVVDAIFISSLLSLGVIGMSFVNLILFEERPVKLVLINVGYPFVVFNIAAVILVLWR